MNTGWKISRQVRPLRSWKKPCTTHSSGPWSWPRERCFQLAYIICQLRSLAMQSTIVHFMMHSLCFTINWQPLHTPSTCSWFDSNTVTRVLHQMHKMVHVWTSQPMVSGEVNLKERTLTLECSIPLPHLLPKTRVTEDWVCLWATDQTRWAYLLHSTSSLCYSGMANEATLFYKRHASCLAVKWDYPHSSTMSWLCCRPTFSPLLSNSVY